MLRVLQILCEDRYGSSGSVVESSVKRQVLLEISGFVYGLDLHIKQSENINVPGGEYLLELGSGVWCPTLAPF